MAKVQKCVKLSDKAVKYVEAYRGVNFTEKLENLLTDTEERHARMVDDWNKLGAMIDDRRNDLRILQDRVRKLRSLDQRLTPLADVLLDLIGPA